MLYNSKQCASGPAFTGLGSFVRSVLLQHYVRIIWPGMVPTLLILCLWTRIRMTDRSVLRYPVIMWQRVNEQHTTNEQR